MSGFVADGMEAKVEVPAVKEEGPQFDSELCRQINNHFDRARWAKREQINDRIAKCERQRRGEYEPGKLQAIQDVGGSEIFVMLTDIKCRAAESWIRDVLQTSTDRPFDIKSARQPDLPMEIKQAVVQMVAQEAKDYIAAGNQISPGAVLTRMNEVYDEAADRLRAQADEAALHMGDKVQDQLAAGHWQKAFSDFTTDYVTYPSAFLRGPVVKRRKSLTWGPKGTPIVVDGFNLEFHRIAPQDIFPAPYANNLSEGPLIERHRFTREALTALRDTGGFRKDKIDTILAQFPEGWRSYDETDASRAENEGKSSQTLVNNGLFETLEYWGPATGECLKEWGYKLKPGEDPIEDDQLYEINGFMIAGVVIKAVLNPDPLGRRNYFSASWEPVPNSVWGRALGEIMSDIQDMLNAAARALQNNVAIASGPQVDVQTDRLPQGENLTDMEPWKVWQSLSDRTGGGQPAIRFFQPDMNAQELMGVMQFFMKQADEVTGIPNYVYGSASVSGAGRTASGLSMLMDNAAKGIKQAIGFMDVVICGVVDLLVTWNMMNDPDPAIKGDFKAVARGAMGLFQKEQLQMARANFLNLVLTNPVALQLVGPGGATYLLHESARALNLDTDKIVPSPERAQFDQGVIDKLQAAAQQMQPGQPGQQPGTPPQLPGPQSQPGEQAPPQAPPQPQAQPA